MTLLQPERVELVRLRLGLTKSGFAKSLGVDRRTVQRFEKGEYDLPDSAVEELVTLSGFPKGYFESDEAIEYPSADAVSFRSLRSLTAKARGAALAAGSIAFQLDDWLTCEYHLPVHDISVDQELSPVEAALKLRTHWGIGNRPIGNMINLLEAHGVRVFSLAENTRHLDAYSLWRNDKPYVFLNTLKTAERSRFDAAHELAHLVMHRHSGSHHPSAETEADKFAAAFLMPPADVRAEIPVVRSLRDILIKKKRWGVSAAALAYTLHHREGVVSEWSYRQICIQLGQMTRDLEKRGQGKEPNAIPRETSQIWTKVLTDLWQRGINLSRLSTLLLVPERELNSLLFGIASALKTEQPQHNGPPQLTVIE